MNRLVIRGFDRDFILLFIFLSHTPKYFVLYQNCWKFTEWDAKLQNSQVKLVKELGLVEVKWNSPDVIV